MHMHMHPSLRSFDYPMSDETGHDLAQAFKLHKRVDYLLPIVHSLKLSSWTTPLINLASPEITVITPLQ